MQGVRLLCPLPSLHRRPVGFTLAMALLTIALSACITSPSLGGFHYEGADPIGRFSGDVTATGCYASFNSDGGLHVLFMGTVRRDWIGLDDLGDAVNVSANGVTWTLSRHACDVFEVQRWLDEKKAAHAVVRVDCTAPTGVHVQGTVHSDDCFVQRPR
jgi:hypothetical protein